MNIHVKNYDSGREPEGQTWTTEQMTDEFSVIAFAAPFVEVRRRADGKRGTLEFTHDPRVYFGFKEA